MADVYFYNLAIITDRTSRFPLRRDTVSNNYDFWTTLEASELPMHSTQVQFYRAALNKSNGKECRATLLSNTRKKRSSMFSRLDEIKNRIPLPTIRVKSTQGNMAVAVFGIQKNQPMKKLIEVKVRDELETAFDDSPQKFTVLSIKPDGLLVSGAAKKGGLERQREISFNPEQSFWKNVKEVQEFFVAEETATARKSVATTKSDDSSFKKGDFVICVPDSKKLYDPFVIDKISTETVKLYNREREVTFLYAANNKDKYDENQCRRADDVLRQEDPYSKGSTVWYKKKTETTPERVTIVDVTLDPPNMPFYTIEFPDKREKQTLHENLYLTATRLGGESRRFTRKHCLRS